MSVPFLDVRAMTAAVRDDVNAVWQSLLDEGDFVRGESVSRFERDWARYCGTTHAIGVANGTDALWLTLRALGVGEGAEVIVPTNTFVATAEAVVHAGARPVFVDVDADSLLASAATIAPAITPRTRAIIVVHLFGQLPDMTAILDLADASGIPVIEDAAQAHGARWHSGRAGSFGVAGCFSFYPGKNLGAFGDGGAVVTSSEELAATLRTLTDHGRPPGSRHDHTLVGFNSRLDTLQAGVLSAKLTRLDGWNQRRRAFVGQYRELLAGSGVRMVSQLEGGEPVYHLAVAEVPDRETVRAALAAENIGTGVHYPTPCHVLPAYATFATRPMPVAEAAAGRILSLPLSPHMSTEDVAVVCDVLRSVIPSRAMAYG